jgi:hypothetical protein
MEDYAVHELYGSEEGFKRHSYLVRFPSFAGDLRQGCDGTES